ncbi:histidine phosphatase family protein [Pseudomonas sp. ZM24]|uniref:lipopolysaccharide core heptose(II)-phosphate phosphatase PmrG n=1 Tax=Pseudomonas triclosanedens TaxID=2961893 RepID=UPI0020C2BE0C|nr:histidine phosphatase family protein [Pseudomonas triclosanedens]MCP8472870.1 histidine phosphatase family protein [Pseudomonas triclosanedens]MCP8478301.1 histidine phosphatase family protein [Pseudomonas triclosanedens]
MQISVFAQKARRVLASRWLLLPLAVLALGLISGFWLIRPPAAGNIAHDYASLEALREHWRQGDLIILVRHAERCDRSSAPCLSAPDGITVRAQVAAHELGERFRVLGVADADIYSSPQVRAEQTAASMFGQQPAQQNWLYDCRGSMLRQAQQHKVAHRNLILVTHSECIEDLEATVSIAEPATPDYASSLFLINDGQGAPKLLGYLDADQWAAVAPIR